MISETGLNCVVSGSFEKFKPDIDRTIEELRDLGVRVLAPDTGWVLKTKTQILTPSQENFRPLASEKNMSIRQVEDGFLSALRDSDFQYIENPEGYIGNVTSLEIGFAIACGVLVFSRHPISITLDLDPIWSKNHIETLAPADPVKKVLQLFSDVNPHHFKFEHNSP